MKQKVIISITIIETILLTFISTILFLYNPLHNKYMKSLDIIIEYQNGVELLRNEYFNLYKDYIQYKAFYDNYRNIKGI